ncbi:hypothetical protein A2U01_0031302, partial [Trifolium medium]|nr:hypothetical protein [Trifolium medium]
MGDDVDQGWQRARGRHRYGRGKNHTRMDISTAKNYNKEKIDNLTTYFVTDFPVNFGAKALFNAFHHYGDIKEVVIPAKIDKGGRRFGFARFDRVVDPRQFEYELDTIIIGRDKISVNLSHFQRSEGAKCSEGMRDERKGNHDSNRNTSSFNRDKSLHQQSCDAAGGTYAQAVRRGGTSRQEGSQKQVAFSYEAEEHDMVRLKKAFIGVAENPGT